MLTLNCTNWSNMVPTWREWAPRSVRTSSFCSLLNCIDACCARRWACRARRNARASADRITVPGEGMWESLRPAESTSLCQPLAWGPWTLHNGHKEGGVPGISLGSTGVPEAPGGRGFLNIFSDPWDTVAENCTVGGKGRMDNKVGKALGDVWLLGEYWRRRACDTKNHLMLQ